MHRKTFTVTYHDQFFFFSDLLIQQPKAALYILKDNVTFPRARARIPPSTQGETLLCPKAKTSFEL